MVQPFDVPVGGARLHDVIPAALLDDRSRPIADTRPSRRERLFIPLLASFIVDNPIGSSSEKPPFANRDQRLNGARLI
jgi:hypothetical protein